MANKQLSYTAERVDELLGIVDGLGEATTTEAGLMSAEDKAKLDGVEDGAEENVIERVQVGGTALTPANKTVNIPADSAPTSESTNLVRSGGVYTAIQQVANALLNYYTKAQVDALLAGVHQFTYQVVAELPDASADTMYILYFVPSSDPQTQNVKDEYITIRTGSEGAYTYSWERIGSTEIDLSDYPTTEEMNAAIATAVASKADKDDDAVEGNLAKFDANGNPVDAGIAAEKVAKKGEVQTFAGNLVDTRGAGTRQGPFAFRQSGGDGVNYMRKILGRTEAFNQLVYNVNAASEVYGITRTKVNNYTLRYYGTSTNTTNFTGTTGIDIIAGHKYLVLSQGLPTSCSIRFVADGPTGVPYFIYDATTTITTNIGIIIPSGATIDANISFICIDLTLEDLGLTTADQFRALHPLPYYNNAGVLKNNAATGLETTGFNQWDEEWEEGAYDTSTGAKTSQANRIRSKNLCPCVSNTTYYLGWSGHPSNDGVVLFYDANKNYIESSFVYGIVNSTFTTPSNAAFFTCYFVGTTYNHDICINRSDASRNGIYEPYWKREIVLRLDNLACHDENNNAVVVNGLDGVGTVKDELVVENGWGTKINKKMGRYVITEDTPLSVFDVTYVSSGAIRLVVSDRKAAAYNVICNKYAADNTATNIGEQGENTVRGSADGSIVYKNTSSISGGMTSAEARALLLGTILIYALATPKVLTIDNPIPALIEVDNLGTEKRLPEDTADNPQAPFECDSNYSISVANLVRKLNS